jgi:hypothetical protein
MVQAADHRRHDLAVEPSAMLVVVELMMMQLAVDQMMMVTLN